jgi:hypothetical protein
MPGSDPGSAYAAGPATDDEQIDVEISHVRSL